MRQAIKMWTGALAAWTALLGTCALAMQVLPAQEWVGRLVTLV